MFVNDHEERDDHAGEIIPVERKLYNSQKLAAIVTASSCPGDPKRPPQPELLGMEWRPAFRSKSMSWSAYRMSKPRSQKAPQPEHERRGLEPPRHRDPRTDRRAGDGEPEERGRQKGEPFGVGIEEHDRERNRGKKKTSVFSRYAAKTSTADETMMNTTTRAGVPAPGEEPASLSADSRHRYAGCPSIEAHGSGARADHGHDDPEDRAPCRQPPRASSAPVNAKGNAKIVCSNLIISRMIFILFSMSFLKKKEFYHGDTPCSRTHNRWVHAEILRNSINCL